MTQEEINHYLYNIELATKELPNDTDLGGAIRALINKTKIEKTSTPLPLKK